MLDNIIKDNRITQYQHFGDFIPKIANLFMTKAGNVFRLKDIVSTSVTMDYLLTEEKPPAKFNKFLNMSNTASMDMFNKPIRFFSRVLNVTYHDMARYTLNLQNEIKNRHELNRSDKKNILHVINFEQICLGMNMHVKAEESLKGEKVSFNDFYTSQERLKLVIDNIKKLRSDTIKFPKLDI